MRHARNRTDHSQAPTQSKHTPRATELIAGDPREHSRSLSDRKKARGTSLPRTKRLELAALLQPWTSSATGRVDDSSLSVSTAIGQGRRLGKEDMVYVCVSKVQPIVRFTRTNPLLEIGLARLVQPQPQP